MLPMRREDIARLFRQQCRPCTVQVVLIPTGLGGALRRRNAVFVEDIIGLKSSPRTSWHCSRSKAAFARLPDHF
jgi:hypothetical protein